MPAQSPTVVLSLSALEVGVFLCITAYGEMQLRMDFLGMEIPMKQRQAGSQDQEDLGLGEIHLSPSPECWD